MQPDSSSTLTSTQQSCSQGNNSKIYSTFIGAFGRVITSYLQKIILKYTIDIKSKFMSSEWLSEGKYSLTKSDKC